MDTDPPPPETPGHAWPPAPRLRPPEAAHAARRRALTGSAGLDMALGLPAGLVGGLLLTAFSFILARYLLRASSGDEVDSVPTWAGLIVSGALLAAACAPLLRRRTVFGATATAGAATVWLLAAALLRVIEVLLVWTIPTGRWP